jgi:uncharacterized membrane protein YfcA
MDSIKRIDWADGYRGPIIEAMDAMAGAGLAIVLPALGLVAGVLTTISGQGGGLVLLLACSALVGPHVALALTSPALLLGNAHRGLLFRRSVDRGIAARMIAGAVPGAFAGGLVAGWLPGGALEVVLVVLTAVAVAKATGLLRFSVPSGALAPAGLGLGMITGTSGGAGILLAPVLLSAGLSGTSFVATASAIAVAMHVGRVVAYGVTGLLSAELVRPTLLLTCAIFAGNALGGRIRAGLGPRASVRLEYGVLVTCVLLSLAGLR